METHIKVSAGLVPSRSSRGESVHSLFQLLEATPRGRDIRRQRVLWDAHPSDLTVLLPGLRPLLLLHPEGPSGGGRRVPEQPDTFKQGGVHMPAAALCTQAAECPC